MRKGRKKETKKQNDPEDGKKILLNSDIRESRIKGNKSINIIYRK
jgi:hypothetical protein